jgi:transposase InsO family protein
MGVQQGGEATAAERFQIIAPLTDASLDRGKYLDARKSAAERGGVSERTVERYAAAYRAHGFAGLEPKPRGRNEGRLPENYDGIVEAAVELRKESPRRSVREIIRILELEGMFPEGSVSRSTLQRHLQEAGFGAKQYRRYTAKGAASRRFQKAHRNQLWQGDIKFGPCLPIGLNGERLQTYLAVWIDDATRFVVNAAFYATQGAEIVEDCLRGAVMRYGKPDSVYVDNGKQYRNKWLSRACAKLGIRLVYAKPYSPESKGKVEAFNKIAGEFLAEAALTDAKTLAEYNEWLRVWICGHYHTRPHSGLGEISPESAFRADARALSYVDVAVLRDAFLHSVEREVDKTGCVSVNGSKYEAGMRCAGRTVTVLYDVSWADEVEIRHKDFEPFLAKRLVIGENCGTRGQAPAPAPAPASSRLLDALKAREDEQPSPLRTPVANQFRKLWEGRSDV